MLTVDYERLGVHPGDRVLDLGCGFGRHAYQAARLDAHVVAFDFGAQDKAFRFLNALQIIDISNNLGDSKSMAVHPPTTTHRAMTEDQRREIGLTAGWVRLSVGLEDATDLGRDISRALAEV